MKIDCCWAWQIHWGSGNKYADPDSSYSCTRLERVWALPPTRIPTGQNRSCDSAAGQRLVMLEGPPYAPCLFYDFSDVDVNYDQPNQDGTLNPNPLAAGLGRRVSVLKRQEGAPVLLG